MKKWGLRIIAGIVIVYLIILAVVAVLNERPDNLGHDNGNLQPCPDSPNCVNTQTPASDEQHHMEPLVYQSDLQSAHNKLLKVVDGMARTTVITDTLFENGAYMHVEYTTPVFRFTDDVEFYIDDRTQTIHFRSASRLGHSDIGANRRRMKKLVTAFNNK